MLVTDVFNDKDFNTDSVRENWAEYIDFLVGADKEAIDTYKDDGYNSKDRCVLSHLVNYKLSLQDLLVLSCLHEAGYNNYIIEDILKDCKMYTECALLNLGKYEDFREVIFKIAGKY